MPPKKKRVAVIAAIIAASVALVIVLSHYYHHDPASGGAPQCLFKMFTGYDCPGCGSQRALHAILRGQIAAAWDFNPFIFFAVPLALYYFIVELLRRRLPRLYTASVHPAAIINILIAIVLYTVLRNI